MKRLSLLLALVAVDSARAQTPTAAPGEPSRRGVAHVAKWITAAGAVGLTVLAAREHNRANEYWDQLLALCYADVANCTLGVDGRYESAEAEGLYGASVRYDDRARVRLIAGQAALLVTVVLFLIDRHGGVDRPDDIPFDPLRVLPDRATGGVRVELRIPF
jgi:hypothetical protein